MKEDVNSPRYIFKCIIVGLPLRRTGVQIFKGNLWTKKKYLVFFHKNRTGITKEYRFKGRGCTIDYHAK